MVLTDPLTPEEAVARLDALVPGNPELNHSTADVILLRSVPVEIVDAYFRAEDRDGNWEHA